MTERGQAAPLSPDDIRQLQERLRRRAALDGDVAAVAAAERKVAPPPSRPAACPTARPATRAAADPTAPPATPPPARFLPQPRDIDPGVSLAQLRSLGWLPEVPARPSLLDLVRRHGAAGFRERFQAVTGCDIDAATPTWEQLGAFDAWMRKAMPAGPAGRGADVAPAGASPGAGPGAAAFRATDPIGTSAPPPFDLAVVSPAIWLKERSGWSIARFAEFCRRTIGKPGPGTVAEDEEVAAAMLAEEDERVRAGGDGEGGP